MPTVELICLKKGFVWLTGNSSGDFPSHTFMVVLGTSLSHLFTVFIERKCNKRWNWMVPVEECRSAKVHTQHVHGLTLRLTYLFHLVVRRTHKVLSHERAAKFNHRFPSGSLSLIPIKYELMHTSVRAHILTRVHYVFPSTRYRSYLATNVFTCSSTDVLLYHSYKA